MSAYDQGREARRKTDVYQNPYDRGTLEERKFYEGWCWQSFLFWRIRTGA